MKRAILWCGQVRRPVFRRSSEGRLQEIGDPALAPDDFKIQANGLELAFQAARGLGVPQNEIHACLVSDDLRPQGLRTLTRRATVADLRRLISSIASRATPEDALLFVAVNHGAKDGLVTSDEVGEFDEDTDVERLTPEILEECIHSLAGPQVIVITSCYAGVFLRLSPRSDRAVLVSCDASELYYVPREDCAWPAFLDELFGAWCEVALSDAVPRKRLPLDEAFLEAERRLAAANALNKPLRTGSAAWPR